MTDGRSHDAGRSAFQVREQGWLLAVDELTRAGWTVSLLTSGAPVQLEGTTPEREPFYFRARGNEITLAVGGDDPADIPAWEGTVPYGAGDEFSASWLLATDGMTILLELLQRYRSGHEPGDDHAAG